MPAQISIVVPCYNEQEVLSLLYQEIVQVCNMMSEIEVECIFIDDGSTDDTISILRVLAVKNRRVRFVSFSRNFGKEAAILAGLEAAESDYIVLMDADLQHPPSMIPEMYRVITEEGYDCVAAQRVSRKGEPPVRSFFTHLFYKLINLISDTEIKDGVGDFRMMRRNVVNSILAIQERNRFSKGIFGWIGFKTKYLPFDNIERTAGKTKWSFARLFQYSLEGIVAFSTIPLTLAFILGIVLCIVALGYLLKTIILGGSILESIWIGTMQSGVELLCMGIFGEYLAKAYLEIKHRPIYLIRETEKGIK